MGARLMWTSKTDRKMDTLSRCASPSPSSGGGWDRKDSGGCVISSAGRSKPRRQKRVPAPNSEQPQWTLRLYVAGQTPKSLAAFANLKQICEENLADHYSIEVIDLSKHPHLAQNDQIVALPTLIRKLPEPMKRLIGDLSDHHRVKIGMDLLPGRRAS